MDPSFAADKPGQSPCGLFFAPTFRTVFLLDDIQPVEVTEKGRDPDQYCRENPGQDVER